MVRLFYKDMKAHESAYRNIRADEAVNDLLLGAKLSTLNNLEEAKNKSVDEVATNFGKFLKALGTKEVPLFDRLNKAEERLFKALERPSDISGISDFPSITDDNNSSPELRKIKVALKFVKDLTTIPAIVKEIEAVFGSSLTTEFKNILKENNVATSVNRKGKNKNKDIANLNKKNINAALSQMADKY